ncbi:ArsR family transcriptional regulator [Actinomadura darangshiensis]|uniref:ArsR family transcriptional regulator n=1 Tax=Actinomadura darangshiensis TaxID=705336 RepID=A0A4R5BIE0_9ACTN|nr:winged helix-turn-helix domain-containing protein [Actinomadura darangshiensis]TDD83604.1 ArsR family transcriptional regulator [Actinomadura darangshiensis]
MAEETLADRVGRLEERIAVLEGGVRPAAGRPEPDDTFWALNALKDRAADPGAVLFTGSVTLPSGEHYEWQQGHAADDLLQDDWAKAAESLSALAHPVRLLLLREIMHGTRTTAELAAHEDLGTTGQLYHHLRQLVAAGWLRTSGRGRYAVPGERVVPILTVLAATRR